MSFSSPHRELVLERGAFQIFRYYRKLDGIGNIQSITFSSDDNGSDVVEVEFFDFYDHWVSIRNPHPDPERRRQAPMIWFLAQDKIDLDDDPDQAKMDQNLADFKEQLDMRYNGDFDPSEPRETVDSTSESKMPAPAIPMPPEN